MDEIDITDSTFDLNQQVVGGENESTSSSMYMYVAIVVGVLFLGYIFYISYNKGKRVTFQDKLEQCYGDVCYTNE
jgi:hypothetical protein